MPQHIAYVDESHNKDKFCLSALILRHRDWRAAFDEARSHRIRLKREFGIKLSHELHSHKLVRGKGRSFSDRELGKWERSRVFLSVLQCVARLPHVMLFNVCLDKSGSADPQLKAWDRMMNRLERTLLEFENIELPKRQDLVVDVRANCSSATSEAVEPRLLAYTPRVFIVADEGREHQITAAIRKMQVINYIPSKFGDWGAGKYSKNITVKRIIEDPFFKPSHRSYFLQLADAIAYALLKREVSPTPVVSRYGIDKMFENVLSGLCYRKANAKDPLGIVRS